MNAPLLSVIVPTYNLEKYIDKCISSIVSQIYLNLEIILINDGSTDQTGELCDIWQAKDTRIKVIHKVNEGYPFAVRDGIKCATGEYITFVDCDDWIDKNMYSEMMKALLDTHSDIAQCDACYVYEDGRTENKADESKKNSIEIVSRVDGVLLILEDIKWHSWFWNKIFKKSLFDDIVFPKGKNTYEDFVVIELFHKASHSVYLHYGYYFYLQRSSSILNTKSIQAEMKRTGDYNIALYDRYLFVKQYAEYNDVLPELVTRVLSTTIYLLRHMLIHNQYYTNDFFYKNTEIVRSFSCAQKDKLPGSLKIDFCVIKLSPKFYKIFGSFCAHFMDFVKTKNNKRKA